MTNAATTPSPTASTATSPIQPVSNPGGAIQQTTPAQPTEVYPTAAQIAEVCPDSNIENIKKYAPYILKAMAGANMLSANQLIGVVATIYTETTPWAPIEEYGKGAGKSYPPFWGRGFVQLTWRENYQRAESDLNIPGLVADPNKALDPEIAARIMMWYWNGGTGNKSIVPYAEAADWPNVRSIINAGSPGRYGVCHGTETYEGAIERGKQVFTQPLDAAAIGALPVDGSYGLNCIDPGSGSARTIAGGTNPTTQMDALIMALGLHAQDRQSGYRYKASLNAAALPGLLKLDAQKKFKVEGMDDADLNGDYTCEDVLIYPLAKGGIRVDVNATKPDPNAPPPQVFLHDTNAGLAAPTGAPPPADSSGIPAAIAAQAEASRGKSSARGPGGGNVACAWAVNLFCILPAGLANVGNVKGQDNVTVSCLDMIAHLEGGRGQKVSRDQAVSGDIWFAPNKHHVGIIIREGSTLNVLSNSSSRAAFQWYDDIDGVNNSGYYGSGQEYGIFRVLS